MKVKIKDQIYDSNEEPIVLILSEIDKLNISNMEPWATKFCSCPEDIDANEIIEFMNDIPNEEE